MEDKNIFPELNNEALVAAMHRWQRDNGDVQPQAF